MKGCIRTGTILAAFVLVLSFASPPATATAGSPVALVPAASTGFALDIYQILSSEEGNLFFSPFSLFTALAMAADGARQETALEMGRALSFPDALRSTEADTTTASPWQMDRLHAGMARLMAQLSTADPAEDDRLQGQISDLRRQLAEIRPRLIRAREQRDHDAMAALHPEENRIVASLNQALTRLSPYELKVANSLWGEKTYPFEPSFVRRMADTYTGSGIFAADFHHAFPAERERINRWTAEQTRGRIQNLVPQMPLDQARLLRLVIVNAIYFKGEWAEPFETSRTENKPFKIAGGGSVDTSIMTASGYFGARYAAFNADGSFFDTPTEIRSGQEEGLYPGEDGFAVLELPYKGKRLAMLVVAPNRPGGLNRIEALLCRETLDTWSQRLRPRGVHILLPRFKLETAYSLKPVLQQMGMARAFRSPLNAEGANFSGMSAAANPQNQLYFSKVRHKAFLEVNEKGTEAVAATALYTLVATGIGEPPTRPFFPRFEADRPFLFIIMDNASRTPLFMGRMVDPQG